MHIVGDISELDKIYAAMAAGDSAIVSDGDKYIYRLLTTESGTQTIDLEDLNRRATDDELSKADLLSKEEVINYWMNREPNSLTEPHRVWQIYNKAWEKHFKYLGITGYFPETNQSSIKLTTYKSIEPIEYLNELGLIIDKIKPIESEFGQSKRISLFERTLSEYGIYTLHVLPDNLILSKTTYGREKSVAKFDNLLAALDFIRINHFYQKTPDKYDEDDSD